MGFVDLNYNSTTKLVLRTIREQSIATQQEIAFITKLAPMTVNNIIRELNAQGIIQEVSYETNNTKQRSGRRAMQFSINPLFRYVIGVRMNVSSVQMILFNLLLGEVDKSLAEINFDKIAVGAGISKMASSIAEFIAKTGIAKEKILGVGIGIPGSVDYDCGLVYEIPKLENWKDCPLASMLENELNMPVSIDNDNNATVMALIWKNVINGNTAYIHLKDCVGAGIALDGKILRGNKGSAGEIGHITVEPNGKKCNCGNLGCLEMYVTDEAILKNIRRSATKPDDKVLFELCDDDLDKLNINKAIEAALKKNSTAQKAFENALRYITISIDIILKTYAPNAVIIDNTWLQLMENYYHHMIETVHKSNKFFKLSDINYSFCDMEDACAAGASVMVLKSLFE